MYIKCGTGQCVEGCFLIFNLNQHRICVKGRGPSMLKATMKVAAGTSVGDFFCSGDQFNMGGMET